MLDFDDYKNCVQNANSEKMTCIEINVNDFQMFLQILEYNNLTAYSITRKKVCFKFNNKL